MFDGSLEERIYVAIVSLLMGLEDLDLEDTLGDLLGDLRGEVEPSLAPLPLRAVTTTPFSFVEMVVVEMALASAAGEADLEPEADRGLLTDLERTGDRDLDLLSGEAVREATFGLELCLNKLSTFLFL